MFPNRGQLTTNTDRWGFSPPSGAYSIRYRQVQENFMKELEERKKEEKRKMSERFRLNAEETLRRQRESKDRKKAYEAAEERHRKEILAQRKTQQRQTLSQATYSGKKPIKSQKPNVSPTIDSHHKVEATKPKAKRTSSFQAQSSVQNPTILKNYESDSALNEMRSNSPHGQGRILLAVDHSTPSNGQNAVADAVESRNMNSALEQLIEELKQPNLDIERFTRQMSTTPFSAKSTKSPYLHNTDNAIKLFPDTKLTKSVKTLNLAEIKDLKSPISPNHWISPSHTEINQQTTEKHSPLIHSKDVYNHENILADSLEVTRTVSTDRVDELSAADMIRVVSVESDSSSSYSPPLSPTIGNDEPIELEDSLDEQRIPTPPLPDLVPSFREFAAIKPPPDFQDAKPSNAKKVGVKGEPWNWVGIADDVKARDTTPVVSEDETVDAAGKSDENEFLPTKLVGILKTSKLPSPASTVRSQHRVRFGGVEYMTVQGSTRQFSTSSLYPNRTFPYRVQSPTKATNLSIIGETKSLNQNSNPITIPRSNTLLQNDDVFSLDSTPTDVDIHLIWNQIRENLRRNTHKKISQPDTITHAHKPIISAKITSKRHPKINRVSIAPKRMDSDLVAWSEKACVQREHLPSQLSIEENKVLASLARLDTQLESKQAFVRTMQPQIKPTKPTITANFNAFSGYKNR